MSRDPRWPGMEFADHDPNDTSPHTDVIKERLLDKVNDPTASEVDREQACRMLAQFFPRTPPVDFKTGR